MYKDPIKKQAARERANAKRRKGTGIGRHGNHARGERNGRWNAGKILSSHGYVKVRVGRGHPLADPNGYAYEHLLVWVSAGNPLPAAHETMHHKNEDKTDNRLQNLEVLPRSDHNALHIATRERGPDGRLLRVREFPQAVHA